MRAEMMRKLLAFGAATRLSRLCLVLTFCLPILAFTTSGWAQVTIIQISDTHLGEPHAPHAAENLRRTVDMVNARHPDAVVLSGDIGENPEEWQHARQILKALRAPL